MNATARTIAGLAGTALVILALFALTKTGFPDGRTPPHAEVLWFHRTSMSALVELVVGVLLVASAAVSRDGRGIVFAGVLVLVPGIVLLVAPGFLHDWVGGHRASGVLYAAGGAAVLGAGAMSLRSARRNARLERAAGLRER